MGTHELETFLREHCKERGLSLRGLSIRAGLGPGTVHSILKRQYKPSIFTLNQIADYLGVKREYLWNLAGLLEDMDYEDKTSFSDPRLRFYFAQADKLPEDGRSLVIDLVKTVIARFQKQPPTTETTKKQ